MFKMDFVKREAQNLIDEDQYKAYIESVSCDDIYVENVH